MTEVPEHLLARSRARRAALGLGGDAGDAPAGASGESASSDTPATVSAAAATTAAAPVAPVVVAAPEPVAPYVQAALARKRVPVWAMPVIVFLPVWAILYAQSLSQPPVKGVSELAAGAAIFSSCAGCHGSSGGGGAGRKLSDGEVLKTFPNIADQLTFVKLGSAGFAGKVYGNPDREGGAHKGLSFGRMPAFANLTDTQLLEVVRHERETLSGEKGDFKVDAAGKRQWPDGKPMLNDAGKLIWSDGTLMLDAEGKLTQNPDPSKPPTG